MNKVMKSYKKKVTIITLYEITGEFQRNRIPTYLVY